jgi:hypothetical protein
MRRFGFGSRRMTVVTVSSVGLSAAVRAKRKTLLTVVTYCVRLEARGGVIVGVGLARIPPREGGERVTRGQEPQLFSEELRGAFKTMR